MEKKYNWYTFNSMGFANTAVTFRCDPSDPEQVRIKDYLFSLEDIGGPSVHQASPDEIKAAAYAYINDPYAEIDILRLAELGVLPNPDFC